MVDILQNIQALLHDAVCLQAFDMGDKSDTAGIVLSIGIKAKLSRNFDFLGRGSVIAAV